MARDVFGNRKITREDMMTSKHIVTDADVRMEYIKSVFWFACGYLYFHFIIMGWSI
tara:strand:- start:296 stop:463 length:168 start_codon:yes stop_codon:yes gene_type:complete